MAAAYHGKRQLAVKKCRSGFSGYRNSAGIGNFRILSGSQIAVSHAEQSVFGLKDYMQMRGQMVGHFRRQPDSQGDNVTFAEFLSNPAGNNFAAFFFRKSHLIPL